MGADGRLTRRRFMRAGGTGVAGAALLGVAGCDVFDGGGGGGGDGAERLNTVLVVADSLRADFVGAYGGDRLAETPNIDALASEGLLFERAVPEAMPTVAVRRALLTGVRAYPFRDWKVEDKLPPFPGWSSIPKNQQVFPQALSRAGVTTAYVTDNPFLIGPRFKDFRQTLDLSRSLHVQAEYRRYNRPLPEGSLAPPEEIYRYLLPSLAGTSTERRLREYAGEAKERDGEEDYPAARVIGEGMKLLERLERRQPFFLGVDSFDPHEAFDAPVTYVRRFGDAEGIEPILPFKAPFSRVEHVHITDRQLERVRELYAGEVSFVDGWLGRLMNKLDDLGLMDSTAVVFVSDHGVYLGERGILGKYAPMIHREIYRVPFIVRHPDGRRSGERSDYFASTHDLAPTLLSLHGVNPPAQMDGEDLSVLFGGGRPRRRPYFTTCYSSNVAAGDGRWLLIADNQGENRRLFDTQRDPGERRDVAADHPDVVERLWGYVLRDAGGSMPVFGEDGVISG
jgi:arylsulfatase A-like enzyme